MHPSRLALAMLAAFAAQAARAATLDVPTAAHPTIQAAVDAAADGDTIVVGPGTYAERLVLSGRSLTLQGRDGAEATVIDGSDAGSVLTITGGSYALIGLTLAHGNAGRWGGAIDMEGGTVRMEGCVVRDNRAASVGGIALFGRYVYTRLDAVDTRFLDNRAEAQYGGAVTSFWGATFTCSRCAFERNSAASYAGAIYAAVGHAVVSDSVFSSNSAAGSAGAVYAMGGGSALLDRCTLAHNTAGDAGGAGYATGLNAGSLRVVNSLLFDNAAARGGALASESAGTLVVRYSTVAGNHAPVGGGIYAPDGYLEVEDSVVQRNDSLPVLQADRVHYSSVEGGFDGTGNVDADCLADPAAGDFGLAAGSPCIDGANPAGTQAVDGLGRARPRGLGFDMGAFESPAHVITASAGAGGSITPSGAIAVLDGLAQTFSVAPAAGYHVADLLVDGASVGPATSWTFDPVTSDHAIGALFAIDRYALAVTRTGGGTGAVTSSPTGIDCGSTCTATFDGGTAVTLEAVPAPDSFLAGWSGACSGTGPCALVLDGDRAVTATFTQYLTVTAPRGGESWTRGTTQVISWRHAGNPGSRVRIELLRGGAVVETIAANAPIGAGGAGSFPWRIRRDLAAGTGYRVRVTSTSLAAATDVSDGAFRIR